MEVDKYRVVILHTETCLGIRWIRAHRSGSLEPLIPEMQGFP